MSEFYRVFMEWVIEDRSIGLILKPKKPKFFNALFPEIHELYEKARRTGRCVKVEDSWGRFPAEATAGADMAVGIGGISTAAIETVIAGCRGVLYDATNIKYHEFYKVGYGRLIFDDLGMMVNALKHFAKDPQRGPLIGDWTGYIKELCPFLDGKGGERMGLYMKWVLDSLEGGSSRSEAVTEANRRYKDSWGGDKVVDMNINLNSEKQRQENEAS